MPNTSRVVLVVAALAFAVALSAHSQGPTPGPGKRRNDQQAHARDTTKAPGHDQRGTVDSPLVVKLVPARRDQGDLAREASERKERAASDGKLVLWTAVVGIATVALVAVTTINLLLLLGQRGELREQRTLMRRQADHLEEQAVQLKATVAQMKDTAERQLRPYVVVRPGKVYMQNREAGLPLKWAPEILNTGQTPAYDLKCAVRLEFREFPLPVGSTFDVSVSEHDSQGTLGAGERMDTPIPAGRMLTDDELRGVKSRQGVAMYVYGSVTYRDTFDDTHHTNFCYYAAWDGANVRGEMSKQHNDAD